MSRMWSAEGYKDSFVSISKGTRCLFVIETATEGTTKSGGDYLITCDLRVADGKYKGATVRFHNITFKDKLDDGTYPAGFGMAVHFLHCIGEPCDCAKCEEAGVAAKVMKVNPKDWIGKKFFGTTDISDKGYTTIKKTEPAEQDVPF